LVTVGDPTTTQVIDRDFAPIQLDHGLTEDEAWCSVAMAAVGSLLVWADTGNAAILVLPVLLLLFFSTNQSED
jgi:hypothetical protein